LLLSKGSTASLITSPKRKMTLTTIAQSTPQVQSQSISTVYQYSFSLINTTDNDIQDNLTAAFTNIPTSDDWTSWLRGWSSIGYQFQNEPQLIEII
jgi:hypothetical protein